MFKIELFWHLTYLFVKLNCLKFNSVLNDPKTTCKTKQPTNHPTTYKISFKLLQNKMYFLYCYICLILYTELRLITVPAVHHHYHFALLAQISLILSPFVPINHPSWQICVCTVLLLVSYCWLANTGMSMWRGT